MIAGNLKYRTKKVDILYTYFWPTLYIKYTFYIYIYIYIYVCVCVCVCVCVLCLYFVCISVPIVVAMRLRAWVCGHLLAGNAGLNPNGDIVVCLLLVLCVVR